jgi:hypothetical protein
MRRTSGPPGSATVEVCPVKDVVPGDEITEVGTPEGPFYRVHYVDWRVPALIVEEGVEVPFGSWDDSLLRRAEPLAGYFFAVVTRDATARDRHGQPYVEVRPVDAAGHPHPLYEIRFRDGLWMLAAEPDLEDVVV